MRLLEKNAIHHHSNSVPPTLGTPRAFVLALSPRAITQSTGRYLPRGAWKFPCSTGAELEVPNAAVVTSNPIDKVGPVARTEERSHLGNMGRKKGGLGLPEPVCSPYFKPIQALPPPQPKPGSCPAPSVAPPQTPSRRQQCPSPTSPAFLLQSPKAPELQ